MISFSLFSLISLRFTEKWSQPETDTKAIANNDAVLCGAYDLCFSIRVRTRCIENETINVFAKANDGGTVDIEKVKSFSEAQPRRMDATLFIQWTQLV